jgi:hypothetical protein
MQDLLAAVRSSSSYDNQSNNMSLIHPPSAPELLKMQQKTIFILWSFRRTKASALAIPDVPSWLTEWRALGKPPVGVVRLRTANCTLDNDFRATVGDTGTSVA